MRWMMNEKNESINLHFLVSTGQLDEVKAYCNKRFDVEILDEFGNSATIKAAEVNNVEILKVLIDAGATVDIQNDIGYSPLSWAERHKNQEMVNLIESRIRNQPTI